MTEKTSVSKPIYEYDYSISFARCVAMIFIVACHMMQRDDFATDINGAHIGWAWWFNVGVQMFLFLSGYLYGKKKKIAIVTFFEKSFQKLLIDYYVFLVVLLTVIHFSPILDVDSDEVFNLITFSGTISGLEHLWFIPTILFCYLLVPIYSEIMNEIEKRSNRRFGIESVLLLMINHVVVRKIFGAFNPVWINNFVLGMIYSRIEKRERRERYIFTSLITLLCLIMIPTQFRIDYWPHSELPPFINSKYGYFCNYGHVFLGIVVILLLRNIYKRFYHKIKRHTILDWSDKYSYDVYLVHHIFIQSPFGCVEFIENRWIALPLATLLTILFSMLLFKASSFVRSNSNKFYRKLPN